MAESAGHEWQGSDPYIDLSQPDQYEKAENEASVRKLQVELNKGWLDAIPSEAHRSFSKPHELSEKALQRKKEADLLLWVEGLRRTAEEAKVRQAAEEAKVSQTEEEFKLPSKKVIVSSSPSNTGSSGIGCVLPIIGVIAFIAVLPLLLQLLAILIPIIIVGGIAGAIIVGFFSKD